MSEFLLVPRLEHAELEQKCKDDFKRAMDNVVHDDFCVATRVPRWHDMPNVRIADRMPVLGDIEALLPGQCIAFGDSAWFQADAISAHAFQFVCGFCFSAFKSNGKPCADAQMLVHRSRAPPNARIGNAVRVGAQCAGGAREQRIQKMYARRLSKLGAHSWWHEHGCSGGYAPDSLEAHMTQWHERDWIAPLSCVVVVTRKTRRV